MCVCMLGWIAKETKKVSVFDKGNFYQMLFRKIAYNYIFIIPEVTV